MLGCKIHCTEIDASRRFLFEKSVRHTYPCTWSFAQVYPTKIVEIVDAIAHLNLLEVADLNALLKSRLNISDAPVMMAGGPAAAPAAAPKEVTSRSTAVLRIRDILVRIRFGSPCFVATPVSLVSMRIRIQFFFLSQCGTGSRETMLIHGDPDPDPGRTLKSQKVGLLHKKIVKVDNNSKKHNYEGTKAFLKARRPVYL